MARTRPPSEPVRASGSQSPTHEERLLTPGSTKASATNSIAPRSTSTSTSLSGLSHPPTRKTRSQTLSKRPSHSGAENYSKVAITSGLTGISAAYAPPCSAYWSVPAACASRAGTRTEHSRWPSRQSRSIASTREAGTSGYKPNTPSACASRSPADTTNSHDP